MPTTSNFGWTTPADTDLVKDGAAAIRTLGNGIDTSFLDLKGGTTGQVLAKASNTDLDFTWSAVDPLSILDAKGDLISATAADTPARLAVGADGTYLQADSTTSTGLKWGTVSAGGMTLITETDASGATSISFTSISAIYKHLLIVWSNVFQSTSGTSAYWAVRLNNDSTSKYTNSGVLLNNDTILASHQPSTTRFGDSNDSAPIPITSNSATSYDLNASGKMIIFDYAGNDRKVVQWQSTGGLSSSGAGYGPIFETGLYNSTSAITQVDFVRNSTQTLTGNFKLYGVS